MAEVTENEDGTFSFRLTEEEWREWMIQLNVPGRDKPRLRDLLRRDPPWSTTST